MLFLCPPLYKTLTKLDKKLLYDDSISTKIFNMSDIVNFKSVKEHHFDLNLSSRDVIKVPWLRLCDIIMWQEWSFMDFGMYPNTFPLNIFSLTLRDAISIYLSIYYLSSNYNYFLYYIFFTITRQICYRHAIIY